ncbi:MAG: radical SAM family heme chaperone HemW [Candidatus Omnitrophica bacterium]|nr:radical SAM family heme chaperone HemW [Candidatus Omnitrophota bacterium]
MNPSLYIHIPFCGRRCVYCNFYSSIYDKDTASSYIDALAAQAEKIERPPSTIYIGGGTPTVLDTLLLERLVKCLRRFSKEALEFTFEANPESLDADKLRMLSGYGVTRLSIGIQSLDENKLKKLGRLHTLAKARESVALAESAGFKNISVDLIFGVWGEKMKIWKRELEEVVLLPITHVSCYELTYERGTPLFAALANKSLAPLEDDVTAEMYEAAIELLSLRGFKQYEVSNFAKSGFECKHNLNYWENNPYIGLGASAVSYMDGVRSKFISDAKVYTRRFREGRPLVESSEKLSPIRRAKETAAIKIRTRTGIDFKWFKDRTGYDLRELERNALPKLIEDGLIKHKKDGDIITGIVLKRKGFLFCDTVSAELL